MPSEQFILLPQRGLRALAIDSQARSVFASMHEHFETQKSTPLRYFGRAPTAFDVIDSTVEHGPKLVEIRPDSETSVQLRQMGFRLAPLRFYRPAVIRASFSPRPVANPRAQPVSLRVVSSQDGAPVRGAEISVFVDFANNLGAKSTTDSQGMAQLQLGEPPIQVDRLYITPPEGGFWGCYRVGFRMNSGDQIALLAVSLPFTDAVRYFYPQISSVDGAGVKVAVLDTGIDLAHEDLRVAGGANAVPGERSTEYGDNGAGHGTHVAGIIAAQGKMLFGLAPGVELRSYRIFAQNNGEATNYSIIKALILAAQDKCDLANLSLSGAVSDEALRDALSDAMDQGLVVVAAAGNDGRKPVSFPAQYDLGLAVTALGRKGTFPTGSIEEGDVDLRPPDALDANNFIAGFSNVGIQVSLTGPGVGILSTLPGNKYGPMSGTSMACPAVSGALARLLARDQQILNMPRDISRTRAILTMANNNAQTSHRIQFPISFQGSGLLL
jgi:subtilisin